MFNKTVVISLVLGINILLAGDNNISSIMQQDISTIKKLFTNNSIHKRYREKKTLLHYAVQADNFEAVSFLVRKNISLSAQGGKHFNTALQDALYQGHLKIAYFLIEKGTPLELQNVNGETALHIASNYGYFDIVQNLVAHGADSNITNNQGEIPSDLIPKLTWDGHNEFKQRLKRRKKNKIRQITKNRTYISIDKKSTIEHSTIGLSIQGDNNEKF